MHENLEEEMRLALFGGAESLPASVPPTGAGTVLPAKAKPKSSKPFGPRLRVTMQVGNEYEGKTYELVHEASTLSRLVAEQDAVKAARKKYRYVEVVSVQSV